MTAAIQNKKPIEYIERTVYINHGGKSSTMPGIEARPVGLAYINMGGTGSYAIWAIVHINTGYVFGLSLRTEEEARKLLLKLAPLAPWTMIMDYRLFVRDNLVVASRIVAAMMEILDARGS